jgi:hypothetical protein
MSSIEVIPVCVVVPLSYFAHLLENCEVQCHFTYLLAALFGERLPVNVLFPISLINCQDHFMLVLAFRGWEVCWNCVKGRD